jgi:hypothetical protein
MPSPAAPYDFTLTDGVVTPVVPVVVPDVVVEPVVSVVVPDVVVEPVVPVVVPDVVVEPVVPVVVVVVVVPVAVPEPGRCGFMWPAANKGAHQKRQAIPVLDKTELKL